MANSIATDTLPRSSSGGRGLRQRVGCHGKRAHGQHFGLGFAVIFVVDESGVTTIGCPRHRNIEALGIERWRHVKKSAQSVPAPASSDIRPQVILLHPSSPHLKYKTVAANRRHKILFRRKAHIRKPFVSLLPLVVGQANKNLERSRNTRR